MRRSDSHRKISPWALIVLLTFLLFVPSASAAVRIFEEPGVNPAISIKAGAAVNAFEQILKYAMGTTLTQDVVIFLCPDRESYLRVYMGAMQKSVNV